MLNGGFTFDTENAQNILLYPTYGWSPKHEQTMAMVALLLKHGANPFVKRDGFVSPMQDAMIEGDVKAVTMFVNWAYDTNETRILFRYMREAYSAFPPGRHTPRNIRMHLLLMSLVPGTPAFYRHLLNFRRPHEHNKTYELLSKCMRIVFGTLELIMARESGQLVLPMELVRVVHFKLMPRI